MKIYSWNLNGIRACAKHGFFEWLETTNADFILLQEVRANKEQLSPEWLIASNYHSYWHSAMRKGYSGTAIYSKHKIYKENIFYGLGNEIFDKEGRFLCVIYNNYAIISAYFPNSQTEGARLDYKIAFCNQVLQKIQELEKRGLKVIIGGDFNIAHTPIDLANPKQNEKNPGFLIEEREWMTKFLNEGYIDSFRKFNQKPENYTWWSARTNAREKNIGWRIDYHVTSASLNDKIINAHIHDHIFGSDHCPVFIEIKE